MTHPSGLSVTDRRALRSVGAQFFLNGIVVASFLPRLPEIRDRVGLSVSGLGLALTLSAATGLVASLVVGTVVSRLGTRRTILVGGIGLCSGLAFIGLATSPAVFVVGAGLIWFCDLLVDVAMNLQGSWISARRRTPVMNRLHALWSFGTVVGGLAAAQLSALEVPLDVHLTVAAALFAGCMLLVARDLLRVDEGTEEPDDDLGASQPPSTATARRSVIVRLAVAGAAAVTLEQTSSDWAAVRLTDDLGVGPGTAALGFVAFTVGMFAGRLTGDQAQVALGPDRLRSLALATSVAGLLVAALASATPVVLAGFVVGGVGVATLLPRIYDEAAQVPGRRRTALAALAGAMRIAVLVTPAVVGLLASSALSVGAALGIVFVAAGATFVIATRPPRSSPYSVP